MKVQETQKLQVNLILNQLKNLSYQNKAKNINFIFNLNNLYLIYFNNN